MSNMQRGKTSTADEITTDGLYSESRGRSAGCGLFTAAEDIKVKVLLSNRIQMCLCIQCLGSIIIFIKITIQENDDNNVMMQKA